MDLKKLTEPIFSASWWWSWFKIVVGCALLAAGYVLFITPYNIVPGGVYGAGIVLHNIFPSIQVGTFGYMFDSILLVMAFIIFGPRFGAKTVVAALLTPGLMNLFTYLVYPDSALESLDPSLMLNGMLDWSDHLMLAAIVGAVILGAGVGLVVREQATTGGTDIVAMILQKYCRMTFSKGVLIADSLVVLAGLVVIGLGSDEGGNIQALELTGYSLIAIYVSSRVLALMLDGASYDRIIFIVTSHHNEEFRRYILEEMDRSGTYIKTSGMYTNAEKEMVFLVVPRHELPKVQRAIKEYDPKAFMVVANAYNTYGEGFKPMPERHELENM
jgi:uncharacterized membrane-anchored protein YitT (DUF2179 family)